MTPIRLPTPPTKFVSSHVIDLWDISSGLWLGPVNTENSLDRMSSALFMMFQIQKLTAISWYFLYFLYFILQLPVGLVRTHLV